MNESRNHQNRKGRALRRWIMLALCLALLLCGVGTVAGAIENITGGYPECSHTWNDGVVTQQPTCEATGIKTPPETSTSRSVKVKNASPVFLSLFPISSASIGRFCAA